ncbi:unnamed protein product [Nesidiocoris tenuis]|uniref:Uncharacterized protein n=1 Tax=Nesidiocoris tenuis TaxID=355587 RepID=A0A6H5GLL6_9HEMI|nr:unnamed protein product [Nesidiocoris tenuis]
MGTHQIAHFNQTRELVIPWKSCVKMPENPPENARNCQQRIGGFIEEAVLSKSQEFHREARKSSRNLEFLQRYHGSCQNAVDSIEQPENPPRKRKKLTPRATMEWRALSKSQEFHQRARNSINQPGIPSTSQEFHQRAWNFIKEPGIPPERQEFHNRTRNSIEKQEIPLKSQEIIKESGDPSKIPWILPKLWYIKTKNTHASDERGPFFCINSNKTRNKPCLAKFPLLRAKNKHHR